MGRSWWRGAALCCAVAWACLGAPPIRPPPLSGIRAWAILLNPAAPEALGPRTLEPFDLLVVDPDAAPPLPALRARERQVLAYLSLGEAEHYRAYWKGIQGEPWILKPNPHWEGNEIVDVRSAAWQTLILEQEVPRILAKGFDGLFLDTLDVGADLEEEGLAGAREGMLELVRKIRQRHPDLLLLSNNGLALLPDLGGLVDGLAVEGLCFRHDFDAKRSVGLPAEEREGKARILRDTGKPVFVIEYTQSREQTQEALALARREGFLPYAATIGLGEVATDAVPAPLAPEPFSRTILALYDSTELARDLDASGAPEDPSEGGSDPPVSFIHENAEMVLNHLGCLVRYHDVAKGLPSDEALGQARGILTWFVDERMPGAEDYCRWFARAVYAGKPAVVLESFGAFVDAGTGQEVPADLPKNALKALGLASSGSWTGNPLRIRLVRKDPDWVEFERDLAGEIRYFAAVQATHPASRVLLRLERTDTPDVFADAVVLTPRGGYAQPEAVIHRDPATGRRQWRLDPFRFFEEAFALGGGPRPDVTTQNGRRVWFSHVDGDGFANASVEPPKLCAEVVRDRILSRFPAPFTVSIVTAEVDPKALGSPEREALARSLFALPNVEPASHGYAHPYDWHRRTVMLEGIPGYQYDERTEIVSSAEYVRGLLPPGGRLSLFLWTGRCNPTPSALRIASEAGLLNMNGGDTRMDPLFPSYSYVAPLTRQREDQVQVHAGAANDNIFTAGLAEPVWGFRNVLATFRNTEVPEALWMPKRPARRVAPVNVYFHFFSASEPASMRALSEVVESSLAMDVAPVFAGDYVRKVQGFLGARLERLGEGHWRALDFGECRTLRFDQPEGKPNLSRSRGCLGFRWEEGARLYVHLAAVEEAEVVLDRWGEIPGPYLESSSHRIEAFEGAPDRVRFQSRGFGEGRTVIAGVPAGTWEVVRSEDGASLGRSEPDPAGRLTLALPQGSYLLGPASP